MGYSGHFDRKTRSPYTLQDVGKYILIFNIIISMQDNEVSGADVEILPIFHLLQLASSVSSGQLVIPSQR